MNQIIKVKMKQWFFIGRGDAVKEVKLIEKITEPNSENTCGNFPLYRVELPDGTINTYTHKFFEVKETNTKY